jgi:epoxide hydrolase-like predicted phosphatase
MSFRAVIFDLGGVVLDSPLHAIAAYERELGIPAGFVNRVVVDTGPSGAWSRLERGELSRPAFEQAFEAECRSAGHTLSASTMMERIALCGPRPRMLEAIAKIRGSGRQVAALTNNWAHEGGGSETELLREHFDVFVESSKLGLRKPDPRIYAVACEALGVEPREAVFLDDIGRNLKAARELGMTTIKVETEGRALEELARHLQLALA